MPNKTPTEEIKERFHKDFGGYLKFLPGTEHSRIAWKEIDDFLEQNLTPNSQLQESNEKYLDEFVDSIEWLDGFVAGNHETKKIREYAKEFKKEVRENE